MEECGRCGGACEVGALLCEDCKAEIALERRDEQETGAQRCPPRE